MEHSTLIVDLGLVTAVAALTAMVARRFKQPTILGYLLAGWNGVSPPKEALDTKIIHKKQAPSP